MQKKTAGIVAAFVIAFVVLAIIAGSLFSGGKKFVVPPRSETIPADAVKMTPQTDLYPPILRSNEWEAPVPMPGPVNTAGAEDSPFMTPDGKWFFFFFTPDLNIPAQGQLGDKVTGIWWTQNSSGAWTEPQRIILGSTNSLDGDEFVQGNSMWFGSVRVGNLGNIDVYTAQYVNGKWTDVKNAGQQLNVQYDIGAFCFTPDGNTLYYGKNGSIWSSVKTNGAWSVPIKVPGLDGVSNKDQPFVTPNGHELWFTGQSTLGSPGPASFRSIWTGSAWGPPVEVMSRFAGEPDLDADGNLYFVHHYVTQNISLIEADIYVAYHKNNTTITSVPSNPAEAASHVVAIGESMHLCDLGLAVAVVPTSCLFHTYEMVGRRGHPVGPNSWSSQTELRTSIHSLKNKARSPKPLPFFLALGIV